jgi:hypothetical protein
LAKKNLYFQVSFTQEMKTCHLNYFLKESGKKKGDNFSFAHDQDKTCQGKRARITLYHEVTFTAKTGQALRA